MSTTDPFAALTAAKKQTTSPLGQLPGTTTAVQTLGQTSTVPAPQPTTTATAALQPVQTVAPTTAPVATTQPVTQPTSTAPTPQIATQPTTTQAAQAPSTAPKTDEQLWADFEAQFGRSISTLSNPQFIFDNTDPLVWQADGGHLQGLNRIQNPDGPTQEMIDWWEGAVADRNTAQESYVAPSSTPSWLVNSQGWTEEQLRADPTFQAQPLWFQNALIEGNSMAAANNPSAVTSSPSGSPSLGGFGLPTGGIDGQGGIDPTTGGFTPVAPGISDPGGFTPVDSQGNPITLPGSNTGTGGTGGSPSLGINPLAIPNAPGGVSAPTLGSTSIDLGPGFQFDNDIRGTAVLPPSTGSQWADDLIARTQGAGDTYNPAIDLRDETFLPTEGYRADDLVSQLQGAGSGFNPTTDLRGETFLPGEGSPEELRSRELLMQGLESLYDTPNRGQIAADTLALAREQSEPGYQQGLRDVGRYAGALGRTNAGMTTNELTDVYLSRERDLDQLGRGLSLDAAAYEMSDRLNRLDASGGVNSQLFNQGVTGRNESRTERDYQAQQGREARQDDLDRIMLEDSLRTGEFNRDIAGRTEQRTERGYQDQREQSARDNELQRILMEEQLRTGDYNRAASERGETRVERDYQAQQAQQGLQNEIQRIMLEDDLTGSAFNRAMQGAEFTSGEQQREFDNEMRRLAAQWGMSIDELYAEFDRMKIMLQAGEAPAAATA